MSLLPHPARRRTAGVLLLALPAAVLALGTPARANGNLTITSSTANSDGQAVVTVDYTCPAPSGGLSPRGLTVTVSQGPGPVQGNAGHAVCNGGDPTRGTARLVVNGRAGSGVTGHDAKFTKGAATISLPFNVRAAKGQSSQITMA
ncbi:hypothetical protein [Kitasatospora purpeofusca]|uniref:hypothetical protein n=1 Tax=Kitasatospora purpeofusca TaxID=67352 RepID=UPI0038635F09|nr:hypothetical protein OIP63_00080 [Kitasatospora purpeofusca]